MTIHRSWRLLLLLLFCCSLHPNIVVEASSAAGQETLVGIVGPDYVMLGADASVSSSIALTASNLDKIAVLVEPFPGDKKEEDPTKSPRSNNDDEEQRSMQQQTIVAAAAGDAADADLLIGLLSAHCAMREFEAGVGCDVEYMDLAAMEDDDDSSSTTIQSPSTQRRRQRQPVAGLTVTAVAHLARGQIASSLRSPQRLSVCLLIAGMVPADLAEEEEDSLSDEQQQSKRLQWQVETASSEFRVASEKETSDEETSAAPSLLISKKKKLLLPRLFWLDEYGSLQKLKYGAHGFGSNFCLSILDQGYKSNLTRTQAANLIRDCFDQLRTRYVINSPQPPCIKCVDADGCRLIS